MVLVFAGWGFLAVFMVVSGFAVRRAKRAAALRMAEFHAYAQATGRRTLPLDHPLGPAGDGPRGARRVLCLERRTGTRTVRVVCHHWWETTSDGTVTSSTPRFAAHYLVPLVGGPFPDVAFRVRTRLGGAVVPVRGPGTGDAGFDRRFLVAGPGGVALARLLPPPMRHAMPTGAVPPWSIVSGVLVTLFPSHPAVADLNPRAEAAVRLAALVEGDVSWA